MRDCRGNDINRHLKNNKRDNNQNVKQMKLTHYIYISTALAMLTACSDDVDPVYTVGEADNAIRLEAGVVDGGKTVQTRANWDTSNAERHGKHLALANGIKLALRVDGTWTGHTDAQDPDASSVSKPTTATAETPADSKHNSISMSPQLYWDDYGTADPANKEMGRATGLTIYGAAVNDASVSAPTISDWTATTWTLPEDQSTAAGNWTKRDLIVSNNVTAGGDGTLKFEEWKAGTANDLLEFKHVMSKITINLKANKGFPTSGSGLKGNTANKFENDPVVKLLGRSEDAEEVAYAITSGKVNIETGVVTPSTVASDLKIITTKRGDYPTWSADTPSSTFQYTVQMSALVFPGTVIGANPNDGTSDIKSSAEKMTIAKLEVDGNIYYINAQKISEAINGANEYKTESGKNYILNIIVDKTEVHVNATVAEWVDVIAEPATPKIDITTSYGANVTSAFDKTNLSFYYSKAMDAPATDKYGIEQSSLYQQDAVGTNGTGVDKGKIALEPSIYWPNHSIKYFFRGVWPLTTTESSSTTAPKVSLFTDLESKQHQGIAVSNTSYDANTFPSNLMIGIPLQMNNDGTLKVDDTTGKYIHDENNGQGISATEGKITLNFTYRMAQVEVHLVSSGANEDNNIDFGSKVADMPVIPQAKVEIVNGYKEGYILLSDGSSKFASGVNRESYAMNPKSTTDPTTIPTDASGYENDYFYRHDVVIPQNLGTNNTDAVKFCVTTYTPKEGEPSAYTEDKYYINVKDILLKSINNVACTSANNKITEWEAGKHYVYTLKITKTQVIIEATIVDWISVVAGGDFWL